MSDWILQKGNEMVYEWCTNFEWYMCGYKAFWYTDVIHVYWNLWSKQYINKYLTTNDYFYWYTTGICHHGILLTTFFAVFCQIDGAAVIQS